MGKAEFSASLLQSLISHDPSEIICILSMMKMVMLCLIFCGNRGTFFSKFFDELKVQKNSRLSHLIHLMCPCW